MLKPALFALLLLAPGMALGADWQYEDAGVPIAYADTGSAQFQFACRGGDLAMGFWVRSPHARVAKANSMNLAISPDPDKAEIAEAQGTSFAQDMPLIHADGSSVVVRGPVARQWARIAQKAKTGMQVAFVHKTAAGRLESFDSTLFPAAGSSAAIRQVLDRCG